MGAVIRIVTPSVELLTPESWFEDMGILVEICGRKSHKSEDRMEPGSHLKFIPKIAFKLGHESIIEHASVTVSYIGSRAMSHQLVRHRVASSYTQESQRYCDYSNDVKYAALNVIVPPSIFKLKGTTADSAWKNVNGLMVVRAPHDGKEGVLCYHREGQGDPIPIYTDLDWGIQHCFFNSLMISYESYLYLREKGVPAEDARFVLPNANKTEVATTYNVRQWRHVFKLRCDRHAQWEIRFLMKETLALFLDSPLAVFFEDLRGMLE
jgi:thymidylate synthase (FAD)